MDFAQPVERVSNWEAGLLRITAFPSEQVDLRTVDWWEKVTGTASEMRTVQPSVGQLTEQGTVEDYLLRLQIQFGRVDWVLLPKDDVQNEAFPLLGKFEQVSRRFRELVSPWLTGAPRVNRLAFGAVLYVPTASLEEATEVISKILPYVNIEWSGIRDFIFQINRPRPCRTCSEAGDINRLSKWQIVVLKKMITVLAPDASGPLTTSEQPAAYWELDINTAPPPGAQKEITRDLLDPLLNELLENATTIVKSDAL